MSYKDVKALVPHKHKVIANNTYLRVYDAVEEGDGALIIMALHGNTIARFTPHCVQLFSHGWHTMTTKNRLNLALRLAGIKGKTIYQKNWQWFYGTEDSWFYNGMRLDYTGNILNNE